MKRRSSSAASDEMRYGFRFGKMRLSAHAKEDGEKFLKENASKPGVTVTASGLQYQVLTQGNGKTLKEINETEVIFE